MDGFLWRPVLAGMWMQKETFDGTYDFSDLVAVNDVLDWKEENERRYIENAQSERHR